LNYLRISIFIRTAILIYYFFVLLVLAVEAKRKYGNTVTACCCGKEAEVTVGLAARPIHAVRLGV
jgi:hypothetical protein